MAKVYTIKTPYKTVTRKRYDAAIGQLLLAAYDGIAANGGLDTAAGHTFYNEVKKAVRENRTKTNKEITFIYRAQEFTFSTESV